MSDLPDDIDDNQLTVDTSDRDDAHVVLRWDGVALHLDADTADKVAGAMQQIVASGRGVRLRIERRWKRCIGFV